MKKNISYYYSMLLLGFAGLVLNPGTTWAQAGGPGGPPNTSSCCDTCYVPGPELILNGTFSAGNTQFSSQYTYQAGAFTAPGDYGVYTNPQTASPLYAPCTDHTTGTGNMLVADGDTSLPTRSFWRSLPILVQPNTWYCFSYYATSVTPFAPAIISVRFNGVPIDTFNIAPNPCTWNGRFISWYSGPNVAVNIAMFDLNRGLGGNEFAIDDISMRTCTPRVIANAGRDTTICKGSSYVLPIPNNWNWRYQLLNGQPIPGNIVSPAQTTTYVLVVSDSIGCSATDTVTVNVISVAVNAGPDTTICYGSSYTLPVPPGNNWTYSLLGGGNLGSNVVSPAQTTSYVLTVTDTASGCSATDTVTVSVPRANAGSDVSRCPGSSYTLPIPNNYTWSYSILNGSAISGNVVSPAQTTTYVLTITDPVSGCTDTDTITVTIINNNLNANAGNDVTICQGNSYTLPVPSNLQWSYSILNGSSISGNVVSPSQTTTYVLTVTDPNTGCTDTDTVTVYVVSNNVTANAGNDVSICKGASYSLPTPSNYNWSYRILNGSTISGNVVSPTQTTTYILTVTDPNTGCSASDTVTVTVIIITANAGADATLCLGASYTLSTPSNYSWSYSLLNGTPVSGNVVSPTVTTSYVLTVTDPVSGCTGKDTVTITVINCGQCNCTLRGNELVANGDFSLGNTGFTSQYNYIGNWHTSYWIGPNSSLINPGWNKFGNTGNFLIADGALNTNLYVWSQSIPVVPGKTYRFCFDYINTTINDPNIPIIDARINGVSVAQVNPGSFDPWKTKSVSWTAGPGVNTAVIRFYDLYNSYAGNDFGLDNIRFATCDDPGGFSRPTGTGEADKLPVDKLHIYPNPASQEINILLAPELKDINQVLIYDMNGRVVKSIAVPADKNQKLKISIAELKKGIYTLAVYSHSGAIEKKRFVKE